MVIMRQAKKNRKQLRPKVIIESAAAQHRSNADHLITSYYQDRPSTVNQVSMSLPLDATETVPINRYSSLNTQRNSLMLKLSTPVLSPGLCSLINAKSLANEQIEDDERDDVALFAEQKLDYGNNKGELESCVENPASNDSNNNTNNDNNIGNNIGITNAVHFNTNNRGSQTESDGRDSYSKKRVKTRLKTKVKSDGSTVPATVVVANDNGRNAKRKAYSRIKKERKATQTLIIVLSKLKTFFFL